MCNAARYSAAAALARATLALLADPAMRERLGQGARARVAQHYTWDHLAPAAEWAYNLALHSKRSIPRFE